MTMYRTFGVGVNYEANEASLAGLDMALDEYSPPRSTIRINDFGLQMPDYSTVHSSR